MSLLLHYIVISMLTLAMTVFFPGYPLCNPMLVYTVYLGLESDLFQGLVLVLVAGLVLDGLTGGPFGVFIFSFLWVFCMVRWLGGFLRTSSPLFSLLAVLSGVLLENMFTILTLASGTHAAGALPAAGRFLVIQMLSALVLSPLLLRFFRKVHHCLFPVKAVGPLRSASL
ncbi:hypothetical protein OOT00_13970 [Desulfobotulus sp. H1]|uniref:Rod shape-determining protein MreD n=1 Tax=Desulfobotulus pelophilus TaxID=2823377 RepID=A0ABT3NC88_9BACT|nr:hypothetical protein [Desulfobotulus pelophilus]MCW7755091.1 hypothetical protein [Desulfobotulus pelophilus]